LRTGLLQIYLNDHLAGAMAGVELSRRTLAENRGTSFEPLLSTLAGQIAEDRETLRALMSGLGVPVRTWKTLAAWAAEKAARLKLNGTLLGYSPLSRMVELEALLLGVEGKASMWRTLLELSGADPRLDARQLTDLLRRAQRQREELEELRTEAAEAALAA
jgi:hypothetical protein